MWWVEAMGAVKHPTIHRIVPSCPVRPPPTTKTSLSLNIKIAKKPSSRETSAHMHREMLTTALFYNSPREEMMQTTQMPNSGMDIFLYIYVQWNTLQKGRLMSYKNYIKKSKKVFFINIKKVVIGEGGVNIGKGHTNSSGLLAMFYFLN